MKLLFQVAVWFLKVFSLPYRITKALWDYRTQQRADAEKLLDMLRRKNGKD